MNLKTILATATVAAVVLSAGAAEAATIKFGTTLYARPGFGRIGYVAAGEWDDLSVEVRQEPRGALIADDAPDGTPGLADVVTLLTEALHWLARPGAVIIELAPHQASAGAAIATDLGFEDVRVEPDLTGRLRALVGRRP